MTLAQRAPLKRYTRLSPKRTKPRRSGRIVDEAYLEEVRHLPCLMRNASECSPPPWPDKPCDPDHVGRHPYGRKCDDSEAVPLCRKHHDERTDGNGAFKGMTKAEMRLLCDSWIWQTRRTLGWRA